MYGLVPAGDDSVALGTRLVLPEAGLFLVFGVWLLLEVDAPDAGPLRALMARWRDPTRGRITCTTARRPGWSRSG
jgi:hypothetical protein